MINDSDKMREVDLMLAALRHHTDDPDLDELARRSVLASIVGDNVMEDAAIAEVGPEQAELDIHLEGPAIEDHAAKAEPFGLFVARTAEAVKELSKARLNRHRYTSDLLISATTPGSLRVVLKAPSRNDKKHTQLDSSGTSNVESDSLRTIAILLAQAGMEDADEQQRPDDAAVAVATIEQLPIAAREKVRSAVNQVVRSGWSIEGELRQRGVGIVRINLPIEKAARLGDSLSQTESTVKKGIVRIGTIDGTRRYTGTMWFIPEGAERPFVATVTDAKLLERVNEINALPGSRVRAIFERYDVYRAGSDQSRPRTTWALTSIEILEDASAQLDIDRMQ